MKTLKTFTVVINTKKCRDRNIALGDCIIIPHIDEPYSATIIVHIIKFENDRAIIRGHGVIGDATKKELIDLIAFNSGIGRDQGSSTIH